MAEFLHYIDGSTFCLHYRLPNYPITSMDDLWENAALSTNKNMVASIADKQGAIIFAESPELGLNTKAFKWYAVLGVWAAGYVKASSAFNNPRNQWTYGNFTPFDKF